MNPVEIQRPSTWVKFTSGKMCQGCYAGCCTLPLEVSAYDLMRLGVATEDEAAQSLKKLYRRLHKEGIVREYYANRGVFIIERKNGSDCYFLDSKTRLCTVYDKRPEVCRTFPKIGPRPGFCPKSKINK
jgi:Fe-S-cluster containining protein